MSNTPRGITRNLLAEFLPNQRAIRAFEQLLESVEIEVPSELQSIAIEAGNASSKSQSAIDIISDAIQEFSVNSAIAYNAAIEAQSLVNELKNALELVQLSQANLQQEIIREKSNGVLLWLSM